VFSRRSILAVQQELRECFEGDGVGSFIATAVDISGTEYLSRTRR